MLAAMALALAACASPGPQVRVEFDKDAPFERYRTFNFQTPLGIGDSAVTRYLVSATRRELESRGLRFDEGNADLRVNFNGRLSELNGAPEVAPHTIGTVEIDLFDVSTRKAVWESVVTEVVSDQVLTELQPAVDRIVAAAFARYPRGGTPSR
jgi:hypothetical protein